MKQIRRLMLFTFFAAAIGVSLGQVSTSAAAGTSQSVAIVNPEAQSESTVQFKVPSSPQPAHIDGSRGIWQHMSRTVAGAAPVAPIPPELRADGDINFPMTGSPLPLLSLIGFGLLIGGATQTMRAR